MKKALSSSPTEALSATITWPCHSGSHLLLPQSWLSHPYSRLFAAVSLPNAYTAICGNVTYLAQVKKCLCLCGCLRLAELFAWLSMFGRWDEWVLMWIGRLQEWRNGWHKQGRVVGVWCQGPNSHHQAVCCIWQLTESLQAPSLHRPTKRSALQSALLLDASLFFLLDCCKKQKLN